MPNRCFQRGDFFGDVGGKVVIIQLGQLDGIGDALLEVVPAVDLAAEPRGLLCDTLRVFGLIPELRVGAFFFETCEGFSLAD